jgi:epimerase transport system membrane fusion protein
MAEKNITEMEEPNLAKKNDKQSMQLEALDLGSIKQIDPAIEKTLVGTSADLNPMSDELDSSISKPRFIGLTIIIVVFGFLFGWSYFAPIDSAAYAPGLLTVESYRKTIQHLDGGIVKAIHVKEGQLVSKGDLLVKLDDTQLTAQLEILEAQYVANLALLNRLEAEQTGQNSIQYNIYLLQQNNPKINNVIKIQNNVFSSRKSAREGEVKVLMQRIEQLKEQNKGLKQQKKSEKKQIAYLMKKLMILKIYLKKVLLTKQACVLCNVVLLNLKGK